MSAADNSFGPHRTGLFDFTLTFEQSILSLLPSGLFLIALPWRICALLRQQICVTSHKLKAAKLILAVCFTILQIASLALWSLPSTARANTSIASGVLDVVCGLAIMSLSYLEHTRSIQPSPLLNFYLVVSSILDIAKVRSTFLRPDMQALSGVTTAALALKAALLVLEELSKCPIETEKPVPKEKKAGVISRGVFWWLNSFLKTGYRITLGIEDIGMIDSKFDSDELRTQLESVWDKDAKEGKYSLMKCTFLAFKGQFFAGIPPRLLYSAFTFAQPFLINTIVNYVGQPAEAQNHDHAKALMGATALLYICMAITNAWYHHATYQLLTMYRGSLVSLVFQKTMDLDPSAVRESAPVTLMSTDVEGIALGGSSIHDIWASLLELPVALYLLYTHVGIPSLFILVPAAITTISGAMISPHMGPARITWNKAIQVRVGETSSMLNQIKGVKMMGLTDFFNERLLNLRSTELKLSTRYRWLLVAINAFAAGSQAVTPVVVILAAIFWTKADQGLSVAGAFTSLSIITIAATPIIHILVSLMQLFGVLGCFARLQAFLSTEPRVDPRQAGALRSSVSSTDSSWHLTGHNVDTGKPIKEKQEGHALNKVAVKSSLPDGTLLKFTDATFSVGDSENVLHNINMEVKQGTMSMVVGRVGCGKSSLLKAMVGELPLKSGTLETGLRNAAFCDQTPWVINVSIKENILGQSDYDKEWLSTVVQACQLEDDVGAFPAGVLTVVGSGGVALSGGQKQRVAIARAVYSRKQFIILDDVFSGLDNKTSRAVFHALLGTSGLLRTSGQTVVLATNNVNFLQAADSITMLEEGSIVRNQVKYSAFEPTEWGVTHEDTDTTDSASDDSGSEVGEKVKRREADRAELARKADAELSRQTGDTECYKIYLRSMGLWIVSVTFVLVVINVVSTKLPHVWLRLWTERGTNTDRLSYMGVYVGLTAIAVLAGIFDVAFFAIIGIPRSAKVLHKLLLAAVVKAPFHFFTSTDNGMTLNRFSQDMSLIDQALPFSFFATISTVILAITETAIIASGSSYIGAIIPVGIAVVYFIQRYYLRTSRQVRFLDLEMKSPLYTQFSETLAGLSTIRAFGWASAAKTENSRRLNISQKPYYTMFCIQRWLQIVLDLFAAGMAFVLVSFAVMFPWTTSKGAIGLAMVNVISFNFTLSAVITTWTQLETSLGAIARLKWFIANTPDENKPEEIQEPPTEWPSKGLIELKNVTAAYKDESAPVLTNLTLTIKPGQKVGVCGRSGSGKSSLIATLSRLLELRPGSDMTIDGVSLTTVPRQSIRTRLTAFPQDAVRLGGTVRHNLDPQQLIQADSILIDALTKTAMWQFIETRGGLDAKLEDLSFSEGQLQLFCLTRVILGRGNVVLLDEATSSVDRRTDDEVRAELATHLDGRTVVEVAHRLDIVRHYDVIIVMAEGEVIEMGPPDELLATAGSEFAALWASRGL